MKLFKNDTLKYIDSLVDSYGGIEGYSRKVEFTDYLTQIHNSIELKIMNRDLESFSSIFSAFVNNLITSISLYLTLIFSTFFVVMAFYFNLVLETIKLGIFENMYDFRIVIFVALFFLILFIYISFKSLVEKRRIHEYATLCEIAFEKRIKIEEREV